MLEDLTGRRFGKLTVIRLSENPYIGSNGKRRRRWICRCDRGKEITALTSQLTRGEIKSCGCMNRKDLTGQRFGRLTVLREADEPYISPTGKRSRRWVCRCDCGNEVTVLMLQLTSGKTQSCGCLARERRIHMKEDLTGKRFGRWTVLHREELPYESANGERNGWLCRCDCGTERVVVTRSLVTGASTSCGCLTAEEAFKRVQEDNVFGYYKGTMVKAIQPERPPNKNNKSGVKGVYWNERTHRWIAKIGVRGKTITIGRFDTKEAAAQARKEAEEKYFAPVIEEFNKEKENSEK